MQHVQWHHCWGGGERELFNPMQLQTPPHTHTVCGGNLSIPYSCKHPAPPPPPPSTADSNTQQVKNMTWLLLWLNHQIKELISARKTSCKRNNKVLSHLHHSESVALVEFMYVPCVYSHARWQLPQAIQVFAVVFVGCLFFFSSTK